MRNNPTTAVADKPSEIELFAGSVKLIGELTIPSGAKGVVLFAHGSGSGRFSPRNQFVAEKLRHASLATLLIDLLTSAEEQTDYELRFDIPLLADRLSDIVTWLHENPTTHDLPVGLFGASTGGGAALMAAARQPSIRAVVSRGGRPDLAGPFLSQTHCATLLIVGGNDGVVIDLNRRALVSLGSSIKQLKIIPGAGHLFEEPGKLEEVARLAADWFLRYLPPTNSLLVQEGQEQVM